MRVDLSDLDIDILRSIASPDGELVTYNEMVLAKAVLKIIAALDAEANYQAEQAERK